jgi:hypothetical protein
VPRILSDDAGIVPQFSNDLRTWEPAEIVSQTRQSITAKPPGDLTGSAKLFFRVAATLR